MSDPELLKTEVLLEGLKFPESPRWHEEKLWFSDMDLKKVMTVDLNGTSEIILEMQDSPSGLGWLPDGRLLIVSMDEELLLRLDSDGIKIVADLKPLVTFKCNDMVVDKQGRAYIGNFGFDYNKERFKPAEIILVKPDGIAQVVADNMAFPNGTVITPDDKTLIVAETFGSRLTAFDIKDDGLLENRRIWANMQGTIPDGICLDAEGGIWFASPGRSKVFRVLEGGKITHEVQVSTQAYACMLGGPDRSTLFVTTSTSDRSSGQIEIVGVENPGAGLP
ncbi:MAG: SMP-30/gluconolactonase/LRE family protein [Promethearchaeota archaeon]